MKRWGWRLFFAGLLLIEAAVLLAGMALDFPKWKAVALVPVCIAAWADWGRDPHGQQRQTGRAGFQSELPTLWVAAGVTAVLLYVLAGTG